MLALLSGKEAMQSIAITGSHKNLKNEQVRTAKEILYDIIKSEKNIIRTCCARGIDRIAINMGGMLDNLPIIYYATKGDKEIQRYINLEYPTFYAGGNEHAPISARLANRRNEMLKSTALKAKELNNRPIIYGFSNDLDIKTGTFKTLIEAARMNFQIHLVTLVTLIEVKPPSLSPDGYWEHVKENRFTWIRSSFL